MTRKMLLLVILGFIFLHYCKRVPTLPEPEAGPRNYTWKVDTLNMPMNFIGSIWGAWPNDIWTVGDGGTYNDRLQHFNGTNWSEYNKEKIYCTGSTLFGFHKNNVWMGGGGGWGTHGAGIWHYNGTKWNQYYVYDIEGSYSITVDDIWGASTDKIYACGTVGYFDGKISSYYGFVLTYNGKKWQEVVRAPFLSQFLIIRAEGNNVYILSTTFGNGKRGDLELYEIKNQELNKIYSGPPSFGVSIYALAGKVYFVMGHDVCRYQNDSFVKQFTIDFENFGNKIYGRHEKDQFIRMTDGIAHYNGQNIEYLYTFPKLSISIRDGVILDKDVFFCGQSNSTIELVIHGRLKE